MSMISRQSWQDFRASGLLWWINRLLHTFGWAIVIVQEDDGSISDAYPAKVKFRGFGVEQETEGFGRIEKLVRYDADQVEDD